MFPEAYNANRTKKVNTDSKERDSRLAWNTAILITTVSTLLFYLIFYRAVQIGVLERPLGFISLLSYPGMLPAFAMAGGFTGNFHTGANNLGLVLFIAIPLNLMFYFFVIYALLKSRRAWLARLAKS
jgi:hypothetical protein